MAVFKAEDIDPQTFGSQFTDPTEVVTIDVPVVINSRDYSDAEAAAMFRERAGLGPNEPLRTTVNVRAAALPGFRFPGQEGLPQDQIRNFELQGNNEIPQEYRKLPEAPTSFEYSPNFETGFSQNFGKIAGTFVGLVTQDPLIGAAVGAGITASRTDTSESILGAAMAGAAAGSAGGGGTDTAAGTSGQMGMGSDAASLQAAEAAAGIPTAADVAAGISTTSASAGGTTVANNANSTSLFSDLAPVVEGVGSVAGAIIAADASRDAAREQANSIREASEISAEAAEQARADIISLYVPAFNEFVTASNRAADQLINGQTTSLDILQNSVAGANQMLERGATNAHRAILGLPPVTQQDTQPTSQTASQPQQQAQIAAQQQVVQAGADPILTTEQAQQLRRLAGGTRTVGDATLTPEEAASVVGQDQIQQLLALPNAGDLQASLQQFADPSGNLTRDEVRQFLSQPGVRDVLGSTANQLTALAAPVISRTTGELTAEEVASVLSPEQVAQLGRIPGLNDIQGMQEFLAGGTRVMDPALLNRLLSAPGVTSALPGQTITQQVPATPTATGQVQAGTVPVSGTTQAPQVGLAGAEQALLAGLSGSNLQLSQAEQNALNTLGTGFGGARQDIQAGAGRGLAELATFADAGESAALIEAALSGALGPEAEQQAIDAFIESPGQQFIRDQQEQAILRNQAAVGGLGGGNVLTALQEQAFGRGATLQQQRQQNLASIASRGQQAAGQQANIQVGQGQDLAQLASQLGLTAAQVQQLLGSQRAGNIMQTGQLQAAGRTTAGQNLANILSGTSAAQAQNVTNLGVNQAGVVDQTSANLANILRQQGTGQADIRTNLATLLANLAVGQGTTQANLTQNLGTVQAAGTLGQSSAIQQGINQLANLAGQLAT